jgi:hypothetical protein
MTSSCALTVFSTTCRGYSTREMSCIGHINEAVEGMVIDIICNGKKKDKTYQQLDFPVPRKMTVTHLVGHVEYGSVRSNREYA